MFAIGLEFLSPLHFLIPLLLVAGTIIWIWALVDCLRHESSQGNDKLIWVLIIVLTHWIGGLLYFVIRRPQRMRDQGK